MTPTSYNDETATLYFVWMTQIGVDVEPVAIYLLRTDLTLVIISTILEKLKSFVLLYNVRFNF